MFISMCEYNIYSVIFICLSNLLSATFKVVMPGIAGTTKHFLLLIHIQSTACKCMVCGLFGLNSHSFFNTNKLRLFNFKDIYPLEGDKGILNLWFNP